MTIKLIYWVKNGSFQNKSFDDISKLLDCLKENTYITLLSLSGNNLGKEGAKALAPVLQEIKNLTVLRLSENNLGKEGIEALVPALQEIKNLIVFDLSGNNLGTEGTEALVPALQEMKNLASLDLSGNNLGIEDVQKLANKLPGCQIYIDEKPYTAQNHVIHEPYLGKSHAEYLNVFEKHNQVSTTKLPSETELCNRSNANTQKSNYIINGAVVSSVLFAVIGGVIAKDAAIGTIAAAVFGGAAVGALLGPLVLYCIAKVCEKVMTKFDDADFTQHTGKEPPAISQYQGMGIHASR